MPTQKCPIITLCKIANAIVFTPKKYSYAQNPMLIFFGVQKPYFFFPPHSPRFFATLPTTHFSGAVINKAFIDYFGNVQHKVFSHFTSLHFGKLKQIYLHLFRSIPTHLIASPHSKRISFLIPLLFPTASNNGMLYFLLRSVCPISNAQKEVIGHFPKEKRIKRKAKVGGSAQCQRSIKNPKDYGIMARQIRSFAK
ncbi:hypothetical protein [Chryseobacterium lacus]|uniref:hypothetical protein n=1 Tax=Chryseobacterium lacus TaxID=2058346 RepID=UPI000F8954D2|nr:hypothetical protein [Chryseobacterium lacus]RST26325.1 hypothetical protein EIZ46_06730 [Chryseobacterium lacus]